MKRALIVTAVASHAFQFCMDDVRILRAMGYEVDIASNFEEGSSFSDERCAEFRHELEREGSRWFQVDFTRAAWKLRTHVRAFRQLRAILTNGYELIHCHTPVGGALCRLAARRSGAEILYTAHGFHFFRGAPLWRWLLFFPVEWLCAFRTDVLIVINHEDEALAERCMHAGRIEYIPGVGVDPARFYPGRVPPEERRALREELGLKDGDRLLLSVGELTHRKNHACALRALALLRDETLHYCVSGMGERERELRRLAERLGLGERFHLLGYRRDVERLYGCADLFVFPSRQEGLPVALMEALASGVPAVASRIRGNVELLDEDALFPPNSPQALAGKLRQFLTQDNTARVRRNLEHIRHFTRLVVFGRMRVVYSRAERDIRERGARR